MNKFVDRFVNLCETSWFGSIAILVMCVLTILLPIALGGLHASGDLSVYLSFAQEFRSSLGAGNLFPGWANDNFGFGSIGIRFYPPIGPYVSALIAIITNNWYDTVWIYFCLWMIIGSWGVNLFVRELGNRTQGVLAAMLFGIVPFRLAEIYQFSLYAEFAAGALIPYCFLFILRICRRQEWIDVAWLAISFSLLILTHIPATVITSISLLIFVPFLIERRRWNKPLVLLLTSAVLTMSATSFYWIRFVTELRWLTHFNDKYSTGMAGYEQWLFPNWTMNGVFLPSYYSPVMRNLDAIIVLTAFLTIPFFVSLLIRRRQANSAQKRGTWALMLTAVVGFFMLSRASSFVWSSFTLLQKIQFPWRWLSVLSVVAVVLYVLAVSRLLREFAVHKKVISLIVIVLVVLIMAYDVRLSFARANTISRSEFYEVINAKDSPSGTSFEAWWPVWASAKALETRDRVIAGGRSVKISEWQSQNRHFQVGEGPPTNVRVATFYYPRWKALVNNQTVNVEKDEDGVITIPISGESSDIYLYFEEPLLYKIMIQSSIVVWSVIIGAVAIFIRRKRMQKLRASTAYESPLVESRDIT